jgi:hypothetical protein
MEKKVNIQRNLVPDNGIVIQNITVRPVVRKSLDIENWRNVLKEAEMINSVRVGLLDLYEEIRLDPVLSSLMEKRILGVTKNALLCVDKDGQENEAVNAVLQLRAFREMRKEILLYKFYGISVIEAMMPNKLFQFYSVPRKNIKPKEGRIVYEQYGYDGIDYRLPPYNKFVFEVGRWDDLGLLLKAAPYVIYKRGGFGDWAHFAEVFGMPFREARYDGYNPVVRAQLEQALEQAGSAGYAILPKEAELTFHEAKSTQGSADLYNLLRQACNEELAILILGQTETTTKTAGKLGGSDQTHENTEDAINMADREDELAIMNELVKPILKNLGLPVDGCMFIHKVDDEKLSTKDKVEMYIKLKKEYGLPMDDEFVYAETGVPKPNDYDAQKESQNAVVEAMKKPAKKANGKKPDDEEEEEEDPEALGKMKFMDRFKMAMADFFGQAHES